MKKSYKTLAILSATLLFSDLSLGFTTSTQNVLADGSLHRLSRNIAPTGESTFAFSPRLRMWAFYNAQGQRVAYGRANGGSDYCPDLGHRCHTPTGTFRVQSKGTAACVSRKFPIGVGNAPMPYCMYFHGGYAIHGSPYISNRNGSHGCIRTTTQAAQWLHRNYMRNGTKVVVLPYS
jgi:lipoprotein-anchoring transpeptidase ErfK/SrfK